MKKIFAGLMLVGLAVSTSFALNKPVITKAENMGAYVDLRCGFVMGADCYYVYRSTYSGGLEQADISNTFAVPIGNPAKIWTDDIRTVAVTTSTITLEWDPVLTDAVTYYFRMQAGNGDVLSEISDEVSVYIPDRAISGYRIYKAGWWSGTSTTYGDVDANTLTFTRTGLSRRATFLHKVSAVSAYDEGDSYYWAPLGPAEYRYEYTVGCMLTEPYSVSLSAGENDVTVSFDGYDGYGGAGIYRFVHSLNPVINEAEFDSGTTGSITDLVDNGCKIAVTHTEGATNYYAIQVIDTYEGVMGTPPNVFIISETVGRYAMSTQVDSYEISTPTSVVAGASFPVEIIAKNNEGVTLDTTVGDSASLLSVMADNESVLSTNDLIVTDVKSINGNATVFHRAYRKAEDIKVKLVYNGKTAVSNPIAVEAGALSNIDVSVNPGSIIAGQTADITSWLLDLYGNRIKSVKVQFQVKKGKGRTDKDEDTTDVTGKVKIKFFHDDITPGINMIKVTAEHLTAEVQVNVAVLMYGKKGGAVVASEDPNTQVIFPPDAVSGDVQLLIKTVDEFTDEEKVKVNNANAKANGKTSNDKVRGFEAKKECGSDYGNFENLVTIEIPYTDDDNDGIVDGTNIKVEDLKVCRLNEVKSIWEVVADGGHNKVDRQRKCVIAQVAHFSTYSIGSQSIAELSGLQVYPNPVNFSKAVRNTMKFNNIPANSKVEIYDIVGRLVRSINSYDSTIIEWDGKNGSGESVSMGLYIYLLTDGSGNKKTGKIGVQK